jgi:hypothetical protein
MAVLHGLVTDLLRDEKISMYDCRINLISKLLLQMFLRAVMYAKTDEQNLSHSLYHRLCSVTDGLVVAGHPFLHDGGSGIYLWLRGGQKIKWP